MGREFVEVIEAAPIVAAVKDDSGLEMCLKSDVDAVFVLYGDICTIAEIVSKVKDAGKIAMVHMDLITGLSPRDISTDFIRKYTRADGIITTKGNLITHAKEIGSGDSSEVLCTGQHGSHQYREAVAPESGVSARHDRDPARYHCSQDDQEDLLNEQGACDLRGTDPGEGGRHARAGKRRSGDLDDKL